MFVYHHFWHKDDGCVKLENGNFHLRLYFVFNNTGYNDVHASPCDDG